MPIPESTASVDFRRANPDDWPEILRVFSSVVCSGDTYVFAPGMTENDARAAWLFDGRRNHRTYVALVDDVVVGTAILKPNQPGLGDHIANAAWMIAPASAGQGVGRLFAKYVLDEARELGFKAMQFNAVVASNHRAIALWESLGFQILGTEPGGFRHSELGPTPLHIMFREL